MSKINIINLLLFVVVVSLAVTIYFSETESLQLDRLTDVNPDSITEITIVHNNRQTSIFKDADSNWNIKQPVSIAANNFRINSILKIINAPVHSRYTSTEVNTDSLGINDSATTIKINENKITFGIVNPATSLRYVELNNMVYTIEDVYYPLISSHFGALVSLNLLPENSAIEKLVLLDQTISKNKTGIWKNTRHKNHSATSSAQSNPAVLSDEEMSGDDMIKVIDNWKHMQAFGIHEYLPRKNHGEVTIYIKDRAEQITYQITETEPWLILARPELTIEYHLDIEAYAKLIKPH